jgi:large subunit ribosomal protein L17
MRHGDKVNNLGRKTGHRRALMKNLSKAIIEHKRINTTLAKAKALRVHLEPLITKAKDNTTHNRRVVFSYLQDKESIKELFGVIAERVGDRPGGYLRIIKTGFRRGDAADMAMIEFVDFNTSYTKDGSDASSTKKKRTRRGAKKSGGDTIAVAATAGAAVTTAAAASTITPSSEEE